MKRLLVTGASGDLGGPLVRLAAQTWDVTALYFSRPERAPARRRVQVDLRDPEATWRAVADARPDAIIHTAVSERSADYARAIEQAAGSMVAAAQRAGCRLIFLSSDMVFDGANPPYDEDAPPCPTSDYGAAKARAEALVRAALRDYAIVRTSLIYDFTPANRQVGWMAARIAQGAPVTLFTDEVRQPVWAHNLAGALLELAALPYTGVLHIAGPEPLTRWDYGRALLDAVGLLETARVEAVRAAEVAPDRPRDLTLDLTRARQALQTPLLTIAAARAAWQAGVGGNPADTAG